MLAFARNPVSDKALQRQTIENYRRTLRQIPGVIAAAQASNNRARRELLTLEERLEEDLATIASPMELLEGRYKQLQKPLDDDLDRRLMRLNDRQPPPKVHKAARSYKVPLPKDQRSYTVPRAQPVREVDEDDFLGGRRSRRRGRRQYRRRRPSRQQQRRRRRSTRCTRCGGMR
jgi:hypothetical protein